MVKLFEIIKLCCLFRVKTDAEVSKTHFKQLGITGFTSPVYHKGTDGKSNQKILKKIKLAYLSIVQKDQA